MLTRVSDHSDRRPPDTSAVYAASKGGVRLFTKSTAVQHAKDHIRCNSVHPGLVGGRVHLDKTLTGLPWLPHPAEPERRSRIETEKRLRAKFSLSVEQRAANCIRQAVALGTMAMRPHDPYRAK